MRRIASFLVFIVALSAPLRAEPPENFAARVEAVRKQAGIPGLALAIVENGEPTMVRGFGTRGLEDSRKVDEHTIFMTGSTGKAMTVAALAILVDEGKIAWDDKVIEHVPWFRLYDPYATRELTIRDLLTHRSGLGLGAGDLLGVPRGQLSRRESVERLAHIEPAHGFREKYQYDNVLYMVAGQLIEEVTGKTWEEFMRERVFRAGGMMDSVPDEAGRLGSANRALPHARIDGRVRGEGTQEALDERDQLGSNMAPAGMQALSAHDLARWLQIQLAQGELPEGGRLWSEEQAREMWKPVVVQDISPAPEWLKPIAPNFDTYALGWNVRDYRGEKLVWHSGGVFGYGAVVLMLPEQDVGIAMAINSEDGWAVRGLMYELLDHYVGADYVDWSAKYLDYWNERIAGALAVLDAEKGATVESDPTLPLAAYAGTYRDKWYGDVVVSQRGDGLWVDFTTTPRMEGRLVHRQYDTFVTEFTDPTIEPALLTFQLDAKGGIDRVKAVAASPIADFSYDYRDLDLQPVGETQ